MGAICAIGLEWEDNMALCGGDLIPIEIGYTVIPAMVVETGIMGEIWMAGRFEVPPGELEEEYMG